MEGDLPDAGQLADWTDQINHHTFVHENIKKFIDGFHHDAHPMGILVGHGRRAVDLLPRRQELRRPGASAAARSSG